MRGMMVTSCSTEAVFGKARAKLQILYLQMLSGLLQKKRQKRNGSEGENGRDKSQEPFQKKLKVMETRQTSKQMLMLMT